MDNLEDAEIELLQTELQEYVTANVEAMRRLTRQGIVDFDLTGLLLQEILKQLYPDPIEYLRFQIHYELAIRQQIQLAEEEVRIAQRDAQIIKASKLHVPRQSD